MIFMRTALSTRCTLNSVRAGEAGDGMPGDEGGARDGERACEAGVVGVLGIPGVGGASDEVGVGVVSMKPPSRL